MRVLITCIVVLLTGVLIFLGASGAIDDFNERKELCIKSNGSFVSGNGVSSNKCIINNKLNIIYKTEDGYKLVEE